MSAVAAVPLRLLNHVFLSLFVCCGARVFVYPRSTYRVVQSLLCEGRAAQLSTPVLSARILSRPFRSSSIGLLCCGGRGNLGHTSTSEPFALGLVSQFVQNLLEGVSGVFQLAPEILLYGT